MKLTISLLFYPILLLSMPPGWCYSAGTPPSFSTPLADQVVAMTDAGGTNIGFSLTCDVSGDPVPTIAWYRGGVVLSGQTTKTLTVAAPIAAVDATLSGVEYFCVATSSTFGAIRSRTATVRLSNFPPWRGTGVAVVPARLGFSVALPCHAPQANPPPHITWTADNSTIATANAAGSSGEDKRIRVLPSGHLVIHDLRVSDFSVSYRCKVDNANIHQTSLNPQTVRLMEVTALQETSVDRIHVYYHQPYLQAEVGSTVTVFNVVAPAIASSIVPRYSPAIGSLTPRGNYQIGKVGEGGGVNVTAEFVEGGDGSRKLGTLTTSISVFKRPRIVSTSGFVKTFTGHRVILECDVDARPVPSVQWRFNAARYSRPGVRELLHADRYLFLLNLEQPQESDSGMYQCEVYSQYGGASGTITLVVKKPELSFSRPLVRETSFVQGDNVSLTVAVKSDLAPTLKWFVRGEEVTGSNGTYIVGERMQGGTDERGLTEYNTTLTVYSINTTYEGEYRIEARTSADNLMTVSKGNVLQERLTTQVSVEFVSSPCLLLGGNVTMRCVQNGVPRPLSVQWTKGSSLIGNESRFVISDIELTLTVIDVKETDIGEFKCTAQNELRDETRSVEVVGELIVSVACVPSTIVTTGGDASPSATFGESVTLTCAASGTPLPTITWMRGGAAVVPSDRIVIETTFSNTTYITSELRVRSVMESDGGSYTCVAVNNASTVTQMFTIEYYAPVGPAAAIPWWGVVVIVGVVIVVGVGVAITTLFLGCKYYRHRRNSSSVFEMATSDQLVQALTSSMEVDDTHQEHSSGSTAF